MPSQQDGYSGKEFSHYGMECCYGINTNVFIPMSHSYFPSSEHITYYYISYITTVGFQKQIQNRDLKILDHAHIEH